MIMISETPNRLRVSLDAPELMDFGLTFSMLDYNRSKTKQMLNVLLLKASRSTSFQLAPGKMVIEAFPWGDGGCTIYFTIHKPQGKLYRKKKEPLRLYCFARLQDLLDGAAAAAKQCSTLAKSELYRSEKGWALAIRGGSAALEAVISEYADTVWESTAAHSIKEQLKFICKNALVKLSGSAKA